MTVADLIEQLKAYPPYHPVLVDVGLRNDESVSHLYGETRDSRLGPYVAIKTILDRENDEYMR